jgi:hypothetical protein
MKWFIVSGVLVMGLAIGSISPAKADSPRAEHTVSWYVAHPADRENVIRKCGDDPSLDGNGDCRNATAAAARSTASSSDDDLASDSMYSIPILKANGPLRGIVLGLCKSSRPPSASVCQNARQAQSEVP